MMCRFSCLLAFLAVVVPLAAATAADTAPPPLRGGWQPIKNTSDPVVILMAEFAVSEYNKGAQGQNKLVFERVVRGEIQVLAGRNFRLIISAKNESSGTTAGGDDYEGVVYDQPWEHLRHLLSFRRFPKAN